jgi:hypothetical protein
MELLPPPATGKGPATTFTGDVRVDTIPQGTRLRWSTTPA